MRATGGQLWQALAVVPFRRDVAPPFAPSLTVQRSAIALRPPPRAAAALATCLALALPWVSGKATAQRTRPAPTAALAPLVDAALAGGTDAEVDAAIDALRERADEGATAALVSLTLHRRVGARRRAYLALASLRGPDAREAVSRGLSDADASIRGLCARALGEMGAHEALPRLFLALERGVHDATRSIGALVSEAELPRYDGHLERVPLGAMLEGYARIVRRADLSWELKQGVLHRLFEVSGLEVRGFLVQWHRELPASAPASLRADLERSIRRIPLRPRVRPGQPGQPPQPAQPANAAPGAPAETPEAPPGVP